MLVTLQELERTRADGAPTDVLRILADRQLEAIDEPPRFARDQQFKDPVAIKHALEIGEGRRFASTDDCRQHLCQRFPTLAELSDAATADLREP